jgi:hypothetical protein
MIHIAKELLQEVKIMEVINRTYRKMEWEIIPKQLPEVRIDEWGSELNDAYDRSSDIINFDLELRNIDKENEHILRCNLCDIDYVDYEYNYISGEKDVLRVNMSDENFCQLFNHIDYKCLYKYMKQHYPDIEIDDELDFDDYIPQEAQEEIHKLSYFCTAKKIAEEMVKAVDKLYKTEGKIIKIYTGEDLLIKRDEKEEKNVTDDDIKIVVTEELKWIDNIKITPWS